MDAFVSEGSEVLYRIALALFKLLFSELSSSQNRDEFMAKLSELSKNVSQDSLIKVTRVIQMYLSATESFWLPIRTRTVSAILEKARRRKNTLGPNPNYLLQTQNTTTIWYNSEWGCIFSEFVVLTFWQFEIIWSFLPDRCSIRDPGNPSFG